MLVFISYPREFEKVAVALDAELKSRKIATFLDKESINLTDVWRLEIEANITKADIFVVLYLPEAAIPNRFFCTETERIQNECAENNAQRLITVIFPPTTPRNLPPFFRSHQILIAEAKGDREDERDGYWIDQIVQEVERLNKEEKNKERRKWRQIIARTALATGIVIIVLLYNKLSNSEEEKKQAGRALEEARQEIQLSEKKPLDGESTCNSLKGLYKLYTDYEFINTGDIKVTVRSGTWNANTCTKGEEGTYILEGKDTSQHDVELLFNGKYEHVGTTVTRYSSEIFIDKNGQLIRRTLHYPDEQPRPELIKHDMEKIGLKGKEDYINRKIDEYVKIRTRKLLILKTKFCHPALLNNNGMTLLAFLCEGYTRAMIRHH
jgi:hypothetical protein